MNLIFDTAILKHHRGEVVRLHHHLATILVAGTPIALETLQALTEKRKLTRCLGIDDSHMIETDFFLVGDLLDNLSAAKKDRHAELPLVKNLRCPYHTGQLTIGENNPLGMLP